MTFSKLQKNRKGLQAQYAIIAFYYELVNQFSLPMKFNVVNKVLSYTYIYPVTRNVPYLVPVMSIEGRYHRKVALCEYCQIGSICASGCHGNTAFRAPGTNQAS